MRLPTSQRKAHPSSSDISVIVEEIRAISLGPIISTLDEVSLDSSVCFFSISIYTNLSQATTKGFGVFFSQIHITSFPASLSLVASLVKSLSLETKQKPWTFSP